MANWDAGLGVLNMTNYRVTCGLSMGATQYYENDVLPGQIFYRWPGAVWETVFCVVTTEQTRITDARCAAETFSVVGGSIAAAVAGIGALSGALTPTALALAPLTTLGSATGLVISSGIEAALVGASAYYSTERSLQTLLQSAFAESMMYAEMKGCYAGNAFSAGTFLVLSGGPVLSDSVVQPRDFSLSASSRADIFDRGALTPYSHGCYHTTGGGPEAANRVGIDYDNPL